MKHRLGSGPQLEFAETISDVKEQDFLLEINSLAVEFEQGVSSSYVA